PDGRLDFVDRAVDSRTGTLALRATFPNPERLLRPGQYVRLRVLLEERPNALVVPQAAVQESQGTASLFVVGPDQTVQARSVRMGPRLGRLWVVEEGVTLGERVVVRGLQQIRPGLRVEPALEPAGGGPTVSRSNSPHARKQCGEGVWGRSAAAPPHVDRMIVSLNSPHAPEQCGGGVWGRSAAAPPHVD